MCSQGGGEQQQRAGGAEGAGPAPVLSHPRTPGDRHGRAQARGGTATWALYNQSKVLNGLKGQK